MWNTLFSSEFCTAKALNDRQIWAKKQIFCQSVVPRFEEHFQCYAMLPSWSPRLFLALARHEETWDPETTCQMKQISTRRNERNKRKEQTRPLLRHQSAFHRLKDSRKSLNDSLRRQIVFCVVRWIVCVLRCFFLRHLMNGICLLGWKQPEEVKCIDCFTCFTCLRQTKSSNQQAEQTSQMRRYSRLHAIDSSSCHLMKAILLNCGLVPWTELPKFINSGKSLIFSILSVSPSTILPSFHLFLRKSGLMSSPQKWPIPWSNQTRHSRHQHVKAPVDGLRSMPSTSCHCFLPSFVMLKSRSLNMLFSKLNRVFSSKDFQPEYSESKPPNHQLT